MRRLGRDGDAPLDRVVPLTGTPKKSAPSPASMAPSSMSIAAIAVSVSQYGTGQRSVDRSVQPLSGSA